MKNIEQKIEKEVWNKLQKLEIASLEVEMIVKEYISAKLAELFPEGDSIEFVAELAVKTYNTWKVEGDQKSVDQIILKFLQEELEKCGTEIITGELDELGNVIDTKSIWKN